jgi:alpha-ketoglutarate-dependent taurine dioxygenase
VESSPASDFRDFLQKASHIAQGGPFDLDHQAAYRRWRTRKLVGYPVCAEELIVRIADPRRPSTAEKDALLSHCRKTNMVLFEVAEKEWMSKSALSDFGKQFGLHRLDDHLCADGDSITSLQVMHTGRKRAYIPYSNRRLNWHTDGYYNKPHECIRSMVLYCVQDAAEGGVNSLLDHEIAYILLRDQNPNYVRALMHPEAITIPANVEKGSELREARSGPVFLTDPEQGYLMMRYSARRRNIEWRQDVETRAAVEFLQGLLESDSRYIFRHRLRPGQGLLCNNVLHNRSMFIDHEAESKKRLFYRARYHDRIAGSESGVRF